MKHHQTQFKKILAQWHRQWSMEGLPSRQVLEKTAQELSTWKQQHGVAGLWPHPPLMATATLDDGIGQGIQLISQYAQVVGFHTISLGLMQTPKAILAACRKTPPAVLGLTVLQLDSDEGLARIGHHLPSRTTLIAGGPVFQYDPNMAQRCGVDHAVTDLTGFIDFLIHWEPGHDTARR